MPERLISEDRGPIRILRLNRPEKLNAFDSALAKALCAALEACGDARVVVLSTTGRAFSAGADIHELKGLAPAALAAAVHARAEISLRLQAAVPRARPPVVAAIRGATLGGGAALALSCDQIVAGSDTRFGFPEIRHGLVPALAMPILARHLGRKLAFDLISSGRTLGAEDLLRLGLVADVVPPDAVEARAVAVAETLAERDPVALAACKALLAEVADIGFEAGLAAGRRVNEAIRAAREGARR